eukprot:CAMPEP_0197703086 /NCGR_PEP_ID=MMETSP1338-20131121/125258_1 /TAXON_ID=43686 ORGANISM="Pelagodinium beii, Strain RCC1491" /NCGR_SAMPLE_ID=MMETSP1338 /ASSEMBLY_ACC=CAM_ASM_000754 /LENGTH=563 /DNA_ID=CAMNT_0043286979 /DNA_START=13 /DNA_END=1705 /DNA_ORIENTATION=+
MAAKCAAEFVGTFLLIFTVGCNVLGGSGVWAGVSIACVLMVAIYALGGISGANFNPAVSVTLGISQSMGGPGLDWQTVGIYSAVQSLAGVAAALCYSGLFGESFNLAPAKGFSWHQAGACELLYTFMLCFVVLNVAAAKKNVQEKNQYYGLAIGFVIIAGAYGAGAVLAAASTQQWHLVLMCPVQALVLAGAALTSSSSLWVPAAAKKNVQEKNQYYGLAIGFVIIAGAYGAGAVSGGCFNPAVALGIDVSSAGLGFGWCGPYILFELVGASLAAALFQVVRPGDFGGEKSAITELVSEFLGTYILVLTVGLNVLGKSKAGAYSIAASLTSMIYGGEKSATTELVSEFLGTYILVLTVGLNVLGKSKAGAYSIAASLTSMIYALGDVSGAHFNPAVTVAIMASGRCPDLTPVKAASYVGVQILAGLTAAYTYAYIYSGATFALGPAAGFTWASVAVAEIVFTFVLCFVVLSVAVSERTKASHMFGLAIGSCVTVGGCAIGGISGGSLNPAVSFGIAGAQILNGGYGYKALLYSAMECAGGLAAAGVFKITHDADVAVPDKISA